MQQHVHLPLQHPLVSLSTMQVITTAIVVYWTVHSVHQDMTANHVILAIIWIPLCLHVTHVPHNAPHVISIQAPLVWAVQMGIPFLAHIHVMLWLVLLMIVFTAPVLMYVGNVTRGCIGMVVIVWKELVSCVKMELKVLFPLSVTTNVQVLHSRQMLMVMHFNVYPIWMLM